MSEPLDLDAVRRILAPLDLTPLLSVVGGDHALGIATPASEVRVRSVHVAALTASLGPGRRTPTVELELLDGGMSLHLVSEDPDRTTRRILASDIRLFQELSSAFVLDGEEDLAELREVAGPFLSRRIHGQYRAVVRRILWRIEGEKTIRRRSILLLYSALLTGIHALESGRMESNLGRLAGILEIGYLRDLLVARNRPQSVADPARVGFLLSEADGLVERLDRAAESSPLPEDPPDPAPLERYFAKRAERVSE